MKKKPNILHILIEISLDDKLINAEKEYIEDIFNVLKIFLMYANLFA